MNRNVPTRERHVSPRGLSHEATPHTVRVRMYRVGFGDCFLLTIEYRVPLADGRNNRHVLIDFGSFRRPERPSFSDIATLIHHHCQGHLDVVVASRRDKDHIAGFADPQAFRILSDLSPNLVVRPWMDDPRVRWSGRRRSSPRGDRGPTIPRSVEERAASSLRALSARGRILYLEAGRAESIERELPATEVYLMGPPGREAWEPGLRSVNDTSLILSVTVTARTQNTCASTSLHTS